MQQRAGPTYTCIGILSGGNLPRPAPASCAVPFSGTARTRVDISLGDSLFHIYTTSSTRGSQFVCAPLLNHSGGPSPSSLVGSWLHLSCAPRHHSATDSTRRGRGTAVTLLGATCHLAANPASLLWCLSLSLRARYRYRSVLHHHLQDGFLGGHFSLFIITSPSCSLFIASAIFSITWFRPQRTRLPVYFRFSSFPIRARSRCMCSATCNIRVRQAC